MRSKPFSKFLAIFTLGLSLGLSPPVRAEEEAYEPEWVTIESMGPTIIKRTLEEATDKSIIWNLSYIGEYRHNMVGGVREGGVFLGLAAARASFDLERSLGWNGFKAFVHLQGIHGHSPSQLTGDIQYTSNIEAMHRAAKVYEAYLEKTFLGGSVAVLFGLFDLNSAFNLTERSILFLHSSFGMGAELSLSASGTRNASTYPHTALAIRVKAEFGDDLYLQAAAFDAAPGGPDYPYGTHLRIDANEGGLLIAEGGWQPGASSQEPIGKFALGAWAFTQKFPNLENEEARSRSRGVYFLAEREVIGGLSAFFRYGLASARVNQIDANLATGLVLKDLLPGRNEDSLIVGYARASVGKPYLRAAAGAGEEVLAYEDAYELSYDWVISPNFFLQPDLQYVVNPGLVPGRKAAWVGAVRFTVSLGN